MFVRQNKAAQLNCSFERGNLDIGKFEAGRICKGHFYLFGKLFVILNLILVTPRMHGIHHSIVQRETNSNWGTMFCWWDKLHRTLRRDISQDEITIGVAAYREENERTLGKLFALPFRAQREWRLPNGEVPKREPQPAEELAE